MKSSPWERLVACSFERLTVSELETPPAQCLTGNLVGEGVSRCWGSAAEAPIHGSGPQPQNLQNRKHSRLCGAGYYIHSCQKMKYKGEYSPSYLADPVCHSCLEYLGWECLTAPAGGL
jgi:hypothetical protein